jgi:acetate kinase
MKTLVLNCGSSSIKYQLYEMPTREVLARGMAERIGDAGSALIHEHGGEKDRLETELVDHEAAMTVILETMVGEDAVLTELSEIAAVGHRVVHGGEEFTGSVLIDDKVVASLEKYSDLAPLHNPPNLTGIRAATRALPQAPQVACFDTAFHNTIPKVAYTYALPYELYEKYGIRRYGFHGTSHRYVARRAAQLLKLDKYALNCITVHLGNGCSMAAVREGRSVDTSMGLTPLEGLVMGTRSGDFDPAILFYLADHGYDIDSLNKLCNKQSLACSACQRRVERHANTRSKMPWPAQGNERAKLAIDVFCYRIKKYIGAYHGRAGTESTPSCSPAASAKTAQHCGRRSAASWTNWGSPSTPIATRRRSDARKARSPNPA